MKSKKQIKRRIKELESTLSYLKNNSTISSIAGIALYMRRVMRKSAEIKHLKWVLESKPSPTTEALTAAADWIRSVKDIEDPAADQVLDRISKAIKNSSTIGEARRAQK